jgi:hypothetical protein
LRVILVVCALFAVAGLVACGGDDDDASNEDDERVSQIQGLASLATNAYAATLGEGLLDYVAADIAENCTKEDIKRALADQPVPTGLKGIKDVQFDGDRATGTVVLNTRDGEIEQEWSFIREGDDSWRIIKLPSLSEEDCAAE